MNTKLGRREAWVGAKVLLLNSKLRHFPGKLNLRGQGLLM